MVQFAGCVADPLQIEYSDVPSVEVVGVAVWDREGISAVVGDG